MAGSTASLQRPRVQRSPSLGVGVHYSTAPRAAPRPRGAEEITETDLYLRRSYALVEQLRRVVAERASSLG
jgi:hypothetical protein